MSAHRSHFRNVRFSDEAKPNVILGGLVQNGSLTEKNFLVMLGIVLVTTAPVRVFAKDTVRVVSMVDAPLDVGDYIVACEGELSANVSVQKGGANWSGELQVSDEPWVRRIVSHSVSGREDAFRAGIRARDGRCVISGVVNRMAPYDWTTFQAAHIFPLEKESLWLQFNYGRWVMDTDDAVGDSKINSLQNGFLLRANVNLLFDQYLISVNPDVSSSSRLVNYANW